MQENMSDIYSRHSVVS